VPLTGRNYSHIKTALSHRSAILGRSQEATGTCTKPAAEAHLYGEKVKMVREHKLSLKLLTPTEKDEAIAKYESGMSMAAVANIYGCHYTTVGRLLRARGIEIRI
jgi:DNA-directed RNA polymerase specialized sigma24 family protein